MCISSGLRIKTFNYDSYALYQSLIKQQLCFPHFYIILKHTVIFLNLGVQITVS